MRKCMKFLTRDCVHRSKCLWWLSTAEAFCRSTSTPSRPKCPAHTVPEMLYVPHAGMRSAPLACSGPHTLVWHPSLVQLPPGPPAGGRGSHSAQSAANTPWASLSLLLRVSPLPRALSLFLTCPNFIRPKAKTFAREFSPAFQSCGFSDFLPPTALLCVSAGPPPCSIALSCGRGWNTGLGAWDPRSRGVCQGHIRHNPARWGVGSPWCDLDRWETNGTFLLSVLWPSEEWLCFPTLPSQWFLLCEHACQRPAGAEWPGHRAQHRGPSCHVPVSICSPSPSLAWAYTSRIKGWDFRWTSGSTF